MIVVIIISMTYNKVYEIGELPLATQPFSNETLLNSKTYVISFVFSPNFLQMMCPFMYNLR